MLNVCERHKLNGIARYHALLPAQIQVSIAGACKMLHAIPALSAGATCLHIKQSGGASSNSDSRWLQAIRAGLLGSLAS